MKMESIEGSETSAIRTKTPGNYPKENILLIRFLHVYPTDLLHPSPVPHFRTSHLPCPSQCHTKLHSKCITLLVTGPKFLRLAVLL